MDSLMDVGRDLGTIVLKALVQPRVVQNSFQEVCVVIDAVDIPITGGDGLILAKRSPVWLVAHVLEQVTAREIGEKRDWSIFSKLGKNKGHIGTKGNQGKNVVRGTYLRRCRARVFCRRAFFAVRSAAVSLSPARAALSGAVSRLRRYARR